MENPGPAPAPVFRFVMAFLAVKLIGGAGLTLYTSVTGAEPPIPPTLVTIAAVALAMLWYAQTVNLAMTTSQIVRFSAGNVLAEIFLSLAWGIGMLWWLGIPLSMEGMITAFGGSLDSQTLLLVMAGGMAVAVISVFVFSAFFAWLISRSMPNPDSLRETFE